MLIATVSLQLNTILAIDELLSDGCCLWFVWAFCDSGDELVELVVVHWFEADSICRLEDRVGDVFADNVGDARCYSFFDTDCHQLVGVLSIRLFLGVTICSNF